jgi:hypothetical protein
VPAACKAILGAKLEAVTFVMDYVQLQFDAAQLTAYTLPQVELAGHRWTSQDDGWRDSLCARIGIGVRSASCSDQRLRFDFEDGAAITVSMRNEDYRGAEAFMLCVTDHDVIVV